MTQPENERVLVIGPDGHPVPVAGPTQDGSAQTAAPEGADGDSLTDMVEQPAKVMRIGTMIKQLLEEV
ncbi:DUF2587 domain-containing protein, partial [Rhodococcus hoagii]|nr:DUF2587 domain-containing protein [Prescottella equi]